MDTTFLSGMASNGVFVALFFVVFHGRSDFGSHPTLDPCAPPSAFTLAAVALGLYEIFAVLALRAHWTMDVYAGAVSAVLCFLLTH